MISITEDKEGCSGWELALTLASFVDGRIRVYPEIKREILALQFAVDGSLLLGTNGGGLMHFKDEHATVYPTEQELKAKGLTALLSDKSGGLWVGTYGSGLYRFVDNTFTNTKKKELTSDYVRAIKEDREGNIWIGTEGAD